MLARTSQANTRDFHQNGAPPGGRKAKEWGFRELNGGERHHRGEPENSHGDAAAAEAEQRMKPDQARNNRGTDEGGENVLHYAQHDNCGHNGFKQRVGEIPHAAVKKREQQIVLVGQKNRVVARKQIVGDRVDVELGEARNRRRLSLHVVEEVVHLGGLGENVVAKSCDEDERHPRPADEEEPEQRRLLA